MGMSKDINNLIKEFTGYVHSLQKGYYKYGLNHKVSKAKEGASKGNQKVNDYFKKITTWISKEIRK